LNAVPWEAGIVNYRLPLRAVAPLLAFALGQSPDSAAANTADELVRVARGHEKAQRWEDAIQTWLRVLTADRMNAEAREAIPRDVRLALQAHRHRDIGFLDRVLTLNPADALALYAEVLVKVQAYYVDSDKVSTSRLLRQGLDEFLAALGDPHFVERHLKGIDDAAISKFRSDIQKSWAGRETGTPGEAVKVVAAIGAAAKRMLGMRTINPVVCEFICGACNSLDEYSAYLSASQYLAESAGSPQLSVSTRIQENIAFMQITHFQPSTPQEVDAELKSLMVMGTVRALVLDLRGNAGGLFTAAVKTAERFLPGGIIVTAQGQTDESNKVYTSMGGNAATDLPLVVLVDGETASAAEVLAVALRDNRRAKLIGTATFGKGTVQKVISFTTAEEMDPDGKTRPRAAVRITLARLIAPSGNPITGVGVTPDQIIPDRELQSKAALEQARELASRYMSGPSMMPMMRQ
jgi:C-terminal processing protease CtpA/Prc